MPLLVQVFGQSNALGRGLGGADWSLLDEGVRVWNSANPKGRLGNTFVDPERGAHTFTSDGIAWNNTSVWFGHGVARNMGRDVDLVVTAKGGASIREWVDDDGGMYRRTTKVMDRAQSENPRPADVMIVQQGETDFKSPGSWRKDFELLLSKEWDDGFLRPGSVILLFGLAPQHPGAARFNAMLRDLAEDNLFMAFVSPAGLKLERGSPWHFDGPSLGILGRRAFLEYRDTLEEIAQMRARNPSSASPAPAPALATEHDVGLASEKCFDLGEGVLSWRAGLLDI